MTAPHTQYQPEAAPARQHTPTPWVAEPNAYGTWFIYRTEVTETIPGTGLKYRQLVSGGDGYRTLTEANAAFIVEAVNSHATLQARVDELTKALERARISLNAVAVTTDSVSFHADVEAIDRALAPSLDDKGTAT